MSEELEAPQGLPEGESVSEEAAQPEAPETATEQPEVTPEEPEKPKHKPWFQARIDELTKEKHDERRAREALEAKLRQMEALTPEDKPAVADAQDAIRREAEALVQKQQFDQRCNDVYSSGAKDFPDFDEKLGQFRHLGGLPPQFLEAVTQLPDAHKVLHALGSDLDHAAHIMSLPPIPQAVALAKLSASPAPRPVSSAPPPIKPIDGTSRGDPNQEPTDLKEWMEWREKQIAGGNT